MYIFTTSLEFPTHNSDFHLLTTNVNAKYYYIYIYTAWFLSFAPTFRSNHVLTQISYKQNTSNFVCSLNIIKSNLLPNCVDEAGLSSSRVTSDSNVDFEVFPSLQLLLDELFNSWNTVFLNVIFNLIKIIVKIENFPI